VKKFLNTFFASFLAVFAVLLVILGVAAYKLDQQAKIEDHSYLVVDLYGDFHEYSAPSDILGQITGGDTETLHRVLSNLAKAEVDERIDGLVRKPSSMMIRGVPRTVRSAGGWN